MTTLAPTFRVLRFTSESCSICKAQKKALIVERFKDAHAGMSIVELVCADQESDPPEKIAAYKLSDAYGVQSFPTLIIEAQLAGGFSVELCRVEGGATVKQIEKTFAEATEQLVSEHLVWS